MNDATDAPVLAANEAFYAAFADRNLAAMNAVWSETVSVVCIHPGWPPIRGRDQVLASFKAIFENDGSTAPVCEAPSCTVYTNSAFVVCRERLGNAILVATNVFHHADGRWSLVHHHASALARVPETPPIDPDLLSN
jgi:ketosteroid isomerase-like protein